MCKTDVILWQNFKQGDRQAFLTIYTQNFPVLFRYCKQITPATQIIEDTIHDLFVCLWDRRQHLGEVRSIQSYLMASTRRLLIQNVKQDSFEEITDRIPLPPFEPFIDATIKYDLKRGLEELNEKQREVLFLKFYNNLSYQEIAEVMGIRIESVYKIAKRSLANLRKQLAGSGPGSDG